jgi:hypothetical protein
MKCGDCSLSKRIGEWSIQCELNPRLNLFAFSDCAFSLRDLIDIRNRYRNLVPILDDLIARREREEAQP